MAYITLVTNTGLAKITAALAAGTTIALTHMAVGDGNGSAVTPNQNQTALVNERYRAAVNQVGVNIDGKLVAELIIPQTTGGFTVREFGLFDSTGALFAYGSTPAIEKPTLAENSAAELVVRLIVQISNMAVIQMTAGAGIIATRDWVEANYRAGILFPGGTTGQILRKKSNVDGDTEWANPTSVNVVVNTIEETQTLAAAQTVVNLTTTTTTGLAVYIDGIRLPRSRYTVNTATRITLNTSYPAGTLITLTQNEPSAQIQAVPIGQIIMLGLSTDPASLFGYGTWARVAEGRAVFGYSAADTDFNTLGKTGGTKTHSHTGTSSTAGAHTHTGTTGTAGSHSHGGATQAAGGHNHGGTSGAGGDHNHGGTTGSTVLTVDQIPSHDHMLPEGGTQYAIYGKVTGQASTITEDWDNSTTSTLRSLTSDTGGGLGHDHTIASSGTHTHTLTAEPAHAHAINADGNHAHTLSSDGAHSHTVTTDSANQLPPYYAVALWQRTA